MPTENYNGIDSYRERRRSHYTGLCVGTLLVLLAFPANAQQKSEFWPEINAYVKLAPRTSFHFIASLASDRETRSVQGEFGPDFDFYLKPLIRPRLRNLDPASNKLLVFRCGYRYLPSISGDNSVEQRGIAEFTGRLPLPKDVMVSHRSRVELRWIEGARFSWRYRDRLSLERSFTIGSYSFSPYIRGELFYDSRYEKISKNAFAIGTAFPITKRTELEPYYEHQNDSSRSPGLHLNAVGLALNLHL